MTSGSVRSSQLISPFGTGAMNVLVDGVSVITCGLDHWFTASDGNPDVDHREFRLEEWRLQERLKVSHFRRPPDYRRPGRDVINPGITVPCLRFPAWSFCQYCKRLEKSPLSLIGAHRCSDPSHTGSGAKSKPVTSQVPFVVLCERGHLDDFPWSEWVHKSANPSCSGTLRLRSTGGSSLAGQRVECDKCHQNRSLEGITNASGTGIDRVTTLSQQLQPGLEGGYTCSGARPWLGEASSRCGEPIRGSLRGASNVYFPLVESSIYLPRNTSTAAPEALIELLRRPEFTALKAYRLSGPITVDQVRDLDESDKLDPYKDEDIRAALDELHRPPGPDDSTASIDDVDTAAWRRPEYVALREPLDHQFLAVSAAKGSYGESVSASFSRIRLVETLRETRALRGFTRLNSAQLKLNDGKNLLWKTRRTPNKDWLPAYAVYGEGIYFELDEERLRAWEELSAVRKRFEKIAVRYGQLANERQMEPEPLSARKVLIHTMAHLVINQLVFECGYSTASLRERLYVDSNPDMPMAGFLIYTAAGDSEGTMGGLVRMGQPENLEHVWEAALASARWCSTDPICMETGEATTGPDSCNLAACYACALLPETSCEEFNRLLDRGLVIGSLKTPEIAFFPVDT